VNYAIVLAHVVSFFVDEFVMNPCLATLAKLKKTELMLLATHYKLDIPTGTYKVNVKKASNLVDKKAVIART